MTLLIVGLVLFLGVHSVRIFADDWRTAQIAKLGPLGWKGAYAVASAIGLVLIVVGYGMTRQQPVDLFTPPGWTRHLASLLTLVAFLLLAAAYVPGNRIKAAVGHPMIAGVKLWAIAHLLANGRAGDVVLFGAFLVWAVLDFRAARARDRADGRTYPRAGVVRDAITVAVGLVAYAVFAMSLHATLIGVQPFVRAAS